MPERTRDELSSANIRWTVSARPIASFMAMTVISGRRTMMNTVIRPIAPTLVRMTPRLERTAE